MPGLILTKAIKASRLIPKGKKSEIDKPTKPEIFPLIVAPSP